MINKRLNWKSKIILAVYMLVHIVALAYSLYEPLSIEKRILLMCTAILSTYMAVALHTIHFLKWRHIMRVALVYWISFTFNPIIVLIELVFIALSAKRLFIQS